MQHDVFRRARIRLIIAMIGFSVNAALAGDYDRDFCRIVDPETAEKMMGAPMVRTDSSQVWPDAEDPNRTAICIYRRQNQRNVTLNLVITPTSLSEHQLLQAYRLSSSEVRRTYPLPDFNQQAFWIIRAGVTEGKPHLEMAYSAISGNRLVSIVTEWLPESKELAFKEGARTITERFIKEYPPK